jgi:hypothetical protein
MKDKKKTIRILKKKLIKKIFWVDLKLTFRFDI